MNTDTGLTAHYPDKQDTRLLSKKIINGAGITLE